MKFVFKTADGLSNIIYVLFYVDSLCKCTDILVTGCGSVVNSVYSRVTTYRLDTHTHKLKVGALVGADEPTCTAPLLLDYKETEGGTSYN